MTIMRLMTPYVYSAYMKTYMRNLFLLSLAVLLVLNTGCNKRDDLGVDVLPPDNKTSLISDSLELISYTVKEDDGRSDEIPAVLVGTFNDPLMGKVSAELNAQFVLPTLNFTYQGNSPVADYAELTLNLKGFYGNVNAQPQKINVYQLTENIYRDSIYYSGRKIAHGATLIGSANFNPPSNTNDSTVLKITLDKSFADFLLALDSTKTINSTEFVKAFKGLCIASDTSLSDTGAIFRFDITSIYSKLRLYYHDANGSYVQDMFANSDAAWFNHFSHTFSNYAQQQIADTSNGKNAILLQGMYGLKSVIKIQNIDRLKAMMPMAINKAELSIKTNSTSAYAIPQNLLLRRLDANSLSAVEYRATQKEFVANLPFYIQRMLEGKIIDKGFELFINPIESASSPTSVVLGGGKNALGYKMKIKIIYTKI